MYGDINYTPLKLQFINFITSAKEKLDYLFPSNFMRLAETARWLHIKIDFNGAIHELI